MTTTYPVTQVTHNATLDDLTLLDYRDISEELRDGGGLKRIAAALGLPVEVGKPLSLSSFAKAVANGGPEFSKALWGKWFAGEPSATPPVQPFTAINRAMRNQLRTAVGKPLLPPTIAEAIAVASPDAEVLRIGDEVPDRIIMLGLADDAPLTIYANGAVTAVTGVAKRGVTAVTARKTGRIRVERALFERVNGKRRAAGMTWADVLERVSFEEVVSK